MPRIIKNIDARFAAVTKAARTSTTKTPTDTVEAVEKFISKNFEQVGIGEGMVLNVPTEHKGKEKSYLAQVRGKLVAVAREGQPWAGRVYSTKLDMKTDPEKPAVLIKRVDDTKTPLTAKKGGRPEGSKNKTAAEKAAASGGEAIKGLDAARGHLGTANKPEEPAKVEVDKNGKELTGAALEKRLAANARKAGGGDTTIKDLTK
jgi:hypothetical protein